VNLGWLIGGTVIIESVFAVPGLGSLLVSSIFTRDHMVVLGVALTFALATVLINFIVDVVTVALDPRIEL
jgi:peptide/nickel transport system permease protein